MAYRMLSLLLLWIAPAAVQGQLSNCGGLTSVDDSSAKLVYPPIAKAAHVQGLVLLLAKLERDGSVSNVVIVNGPQMLRESADNFVRKWRVNTYTGPRTCPIAVSYYLGIGNVPSSQSISLEDPQHVAVHSGVPLVIPQTTSSAISSDVQHWTVRATTPCLCDPAGVIGRKKRSGIF